jgi:hypothetical protein
MELPNQAFVVCGTTNYEIFRGTGVYVYASKINGLPIIQPVSTALCRSQKPWSVTKQYILDYNTLSNDTLWNSTLNTLWNSTLSEPSHNSTQVESINDPSSDNPSLRSVLDTACWLHYCPLLDPISYHDESNPVTNRLYEYMRSYNLTNNQSLETFDRDFLRQYAFTYYAAEGIYDTCVCRLRDTRGSNIYFQVNTFMVVLWSGIIVWAGFLFGVSPHHVMHRALSIPNGLGMWCHPKYEYYTNDAWARVWNYQLVFCLPYTARLIVSWSAWMYHWTTWRYVSWISTLSFLCDLFWILVPVVLVYHRLLSPVRVP